MIKVAIADDHTMFRKGLSSIINGWKDVKLCVEASDGVELLHEIAQTPVDIVLLDLQMPGMSGLETCAILRKEYPDLKILILTFLAGTSEIIDAMKLGANGYFTKNSHPDELHKAITNLNDDGFYFEKSLSQLMESFDLNPNGHTNIKSQTDISKRELEIIKLYALEYTGKQIAENLGISIRTVESHKKNLMKKTDSKNFIGVILFALERNILSIQDLK